MIYYPSNPVNVSMSKRVFAINIADVFLSFVPHVSTSYADSINISNRVTIYCPIKRNNNCRSRRRVMIFKFADASIISEISSGVISLCKKVQ